MECTCIILLEDDRDCLTTTKQCTRLAVWRRGGSANGGDIKTSPKGAWQQLESIPFTLSGCYELAEMRNRIKALERHLPQGAVIAGTSISGLAYSEFSRMGFCLCELDTFSPDILDALASEILASAQGEVQVPTAPTLTDIPGVYSINLMEVQAAHPDVTSKKALRPFFDSTPFVELELVCGHMPPWLEEYLRQHHLTCSRMRQDDGTVHARISHALCGEGAANECQEPRQ